jgi:cobalamin biosynthetic protein CobC
MAATAFGMADPARVVATAGAEAALRLLPELLNAETVMIAGPTYASHADAWSQSGARLVCEEEAATAVVVVNPNNPDGRVHDHALLLARADRLVSRGGWMVVDESFADVQPSASIAAAGHPAIVALRSFGKFYGLAGLRLGFVLGDPELIRRVRDRQGDWPISADALAAGTTAYADAAWASRTRARLVRDAERLDMALRAGGFEPVGGTALFRLVRANDAAGRFAALCANGVLSRPFAEQPTWLRFGLPHPSAWRRVENALKALA